LSWRASGQRPARHDRFRDDRHQPAVEAGTADEQRPAVAA
jgi:hypothetical protein